VSSAIIEAAPGDVILLKHNGQLTIEPTILTATRQVKLRPYGDAHPVLVFGKPPEKDTEKDYALFQLFHSQMDFEKLEFLLQPAGDYRSLAVVSLGGNSLCQFKDCVVTLDNSANPGVSVQLATLLDPQKAMKMPTPEPRPCPRLRLSGCLVRGNGDLLSVRVSRPFDLDLEQCLLCLGGSLANIKPGTGELSGVDTKVHIDLNRVTAWMGKPLLSFRSASNGRDLVPAQVTALHCLFAAAAGEPLVRIHGLDNEEQTRKLLSWTGSSNAYGNYMKLLEQPPTNESAMTLAFYPDDWKRFSGDNGTETLYKNAVNVVDATIDRAFQEMLPEHFRPMTKTDVAGYGAMLDQVPTPHALDKSE
jgi:hypothetical protein